MIRIELEFASLAEASPVFAALAAGPTHVSFAKIVADTGDEPHADDTPAEAEAKEKRKRRTKAEMEAYRLQQKLESGPSETLAAAQVSPTFSGQPASASGPVTIVGGAAGPIEKLPPGGDDISDIHAEASYTDALAEYLAVYPDKDEAAFLRAQLHRVVDVAGMDGVQAFMSDNGFRKVSNIPAEDRQRFFEAVNALVSK